MAKAEVVPVTAPNERDVATLSRCGNVLNVPSSFRAVIPSEKFPAEAGRYVLYIYPGCPWAQRTTIVHKLKGLENIVQVVYIDSIEPGKGWCFSGEGTFGFKRDPVYGCKYLKDVYAIANPAYEGRTLIPALLDRKQNAIVSNDSGEIIRMFYTAFDHLLPIEAREATKGPAGLRPEHLQSQIDEFNDFVYESITNGVYKTGFAPSQKAYNESCLRLFEALDRVEALLSRPGHGPYILGEHVTEADIRLFPAIVRFDIAYHTLFKCNLKMIRYDYPRIHNWMRRLYWEESTSFAFKDTTIVQCIKEGYTRAAGETIVPLGPQPDVLPL